MTTQHVFQRWLSIKMCVAKLLHDDTSLQSTASWNVWCGENDWIFKVICLKRCDDIMLWRSILRLPRLNRCNDKIMLQPQSRLEIKCSQQVRRHCILTATNENWRWLVSGGETRYWFIQSIGVTTKRCCTRRQNQHMSSCCRMATRDSLPWLRCPKRRERVR